MEQIYKEKAKELFDKYAMYLRSGLMFADEANEDAKYCALIAVDELIKETGAKYWYNVKKEIELL